MGKYYRGNIHFEGSSIKIHRIGFTTKLHVLGKHYLTSLGIFLQVQNVMIASVLPIHKLAIKVNSIMYIKILGTQCTGWSHQPIQNPTPKCTNLPHPYLCFIYTPLIFRNEIILQICYRLSPGWEFFF